MDLRLRNQPRGLGTRLIILLNVLKEKFGMDYVRNNPDYEGVDQSVDYLNRAFARARRDYIDATGEKSVREGVYSRESRKWKPTRIYKFEVDFCYLINEIQQGHIYMSSKFIAEANELIRRLVESTPTSQSGQ